MPVTKKARKEAEHKDLWKHYKERRISTNANGKRKMVVLIRQANKWNKTANEKAQEKRMKMKVKKMKKDRRERGMDESPLLRPDRKSLTASN